MQGKGSNIKKKNGPVILVQLAQWIYFIPFIIAIGILLASATITTVYFDTLQESDLPRFTSENIPLLGIFVIAGFWIIYYLLIERKLGSFSGANKVVQGKQLPINRAMKVALIWCCAVCMFLILTVRGLAVNDALTLDYIVEQFMEGDYSALQKGGYLFVYPFQIGYVAIGQLLHIIFGSSNYIVYQLLNTVSVLMTVYLLYEITWELFEDTLVCNVMAVISFGCLFFYIYSTLIYNDIWSIAPQVTGLYLTIRYLKYHNWSDMVCAGVWNGIAVVIKSNAYISLVAMVIVLILDGLQGDDRQYKQAKPKSSLRPEHKFDYKRLVCNLILIVCIFTISKAMTGAINRGYAKATGLASMPAGVPSATYFAMGMHENDGGGEWGWYDGFNVRTYGANDYDREATTVAAKEELKETFALYKSHPKYAVHFFLRKFLTQWSDESLMAIRNLELTARHVDGQPQIVKSIIFGKGRTVLRWIMNVYQELTLIGVAIFAISRVRKKSIPLIQGFWVLFIFGGMLFHEIWEGQGRYVIRYTVCFLPLASYGIAILLRRIEQIANARKMR